MAIGVLRCGRTGDPLDSLCSNIDRHDPTRVLGPLLEHVIGPVLVFAAVYVAGRLIRRLLVRAMQRARGDAQVRALLNNVITVATVVLAVLGALTAAGLDISVLLTFGGLFSLAIGLAFQDLLRNILAGIFLLLERPFRIGDTITVGDQSGVVQTIHLRTTQLRTADGRLAILPNLSAFSNTVVNSSAFVTRRYEVSVWVPATVALAATLRVVRRELGRTAGISTDSPATVQPRVDLDSGATMLECRYWLDYREHDPDAVAADLSERLRAAVRALADAAEPPTTATASTRTA